MSRNKPDRAEIAYLPDLSYMCDHDIQYSQADQSTADVIRIIF